MIHAACEKHYPIRIEYLTHKSFYKYLRLFSPSFFFLHIVLFAYCILFIRFSASAFHTIYDSVILFNLSYFIRFNWLLIFDGHNFFSLYSPNIRQQNFWHFLYNMIFWGLKLIRGFPSQKVFSARIPTTGHQNELLQMCITSLVILDFSSSWLMSGRMVGCSVSKSIHIFLGSKWRENKDRYKNWRVMNIIRSWVRWSSRKCGALPEMSVCKVDCAFKCCVIVFDFAVI